MKPSQNIGDLLNKQIQSEFYASYLYLSMSAYCESRNLLGFARYMRQQSQEEHSHAMRLFDYVQHRGGAGYSSDHRSPTCRVPFCARNVSASA